eukprot:1249205-Amphidinium_carterae.1
MAMNRCSLCSIWPQPRRGWVGTVHRFPLHWADFVKPCIHSRLPSDHMLKTVHLLLVPVPKV